MEIETAFYIMASILGASIAVLIFFAIIGEM